MSFTPVIPSSYQTDRQDLNGAIAALIDAFILSESYAVGRIFWSEVPASLTGEAPMIVLGDIVESVSHDMQVRITTFTGTLWYIDWITDRAEFNTRVNRWADRMRDLFTYNVSLVNPKAELRQTGLQESELRQGDIVVGAPSLTFQYIVQQGYR